MKNIQDAHYIGIEEGKTQVITRTYKCNLLRILVYLGLSGLTCYLIYLLYAKMYLNSINNLHFVTASINRYANNDDSRIILKRDNYADEVIICGTRCQNYVDTVCSIVDYNSLYPNEWQYKIDECIAHIDDLNQDGHKMSLYDGDYCTKCCQKNCCTKRLCPCICNCGSCWSINGIIACVSLAIFFLGRALSHSFIELCSVSTTIDFLK